MPSASDWVAVRVDPSRQVANPIGYLPAPYDNGSVISLPAVDWIAGAVRVQGWLGLGIGRPTEALFSRGARVNSHELDEDGQFAALIGSRRVDVALGSGNNSLTLDLDALGIPRQAGYRTYDDAPKPMPIDFSVQQGDAYVRLRQPLCVGPGVSYLRAHRAHAALPMIVGWDGGPRAGNVLGLPFFYGRTVATGLEGSVNPFRHASRVDCRQAQMSDKRTLRAGSGSQAVPQFTDGKLP